MPFSKQPMPYFPRQCKAYSGSLLPCSGENAIHPVVVVAEVAEDVAELIDHKREDTLQFVISVRKIMIS